MKPLVLMAIVLAVLPAALPAGEVSASDAGKFTKQLER